MSVPGNCFGSQWLRVGHCVRPVPSFGASRPNLTPGTITTALGTGVRGFAGDGLSATSATVNSPVDIVLASIVGTTGTTVFVSSLNGSTGGYCVRQISASGVASTVPLPSAYFNGFIRGGAFEINKGSLYAASEPGVIARVVLATGDVFPVAGNGTAGFSGDNGPATLAQLGANLWGMCADSSGNLYVSDTLNNRVRKIVLYPGRHDDHPPLHLTDHPLLHQDMSLIQTGAIRVWPKDDTTIVCRYYCTTRTLMSLCQSPLTCLCLIPSSPL